MRGIPGGSRKAGSLPRGSAAQPKLVHSYVSPGETAGDSTGTGGVKHAAIVRLVSRAVNRKLKLKMKKASVGNWMESGVPTAIPVLDSRASTCRGRKNGSQIGIFYLCEANPLTSRPVLVIVKRFHKSGVACVL